MFGGVDFRVFFYLVLGGFLLWGFGWLLSFFPPLFH